MNEPEWEEWQSSNVMAGAYDAQAQKLYLRFKDGSVYEYDDVPQKVWEEMRTAESKGKYRHQFIVGYPYRIVAGPPAILKGRRK